MFGDPEHPFGRNGQTREFMPAALRNVKNVLGNRTDFHECHWIRHLHTLGLLHAAFRPQGEVCAVRSLMRHRNHLVQVASQDVQHMQKALTQMNV